MGHRCAQMGALRIGVMMGAWMGSQSGGWMGRQESGNSSARALAGIGRGGVRWICIIPIP